MDAGLVRENHVRLSQPGARRSHPVQFSQHEVLHGLVDGPELRDGERKAIDVTALYAFGGAANGELEYADGKKAWHHRMSSRPGMVAGQSIARLIDRQRETYDAQRVRDILLFYLRERASTHNLTFAKSREPFTIPKWREPKEGPDGTIDCVGGKGACKEVQEKKKRSSFQSRMGLAATVGDAAEQQGLASGGGGHASTHAPAPAAPSAFRPQPVAPRGGGVNGFGGFRGGGGELAPAPALPTCLLQPAALPSSVGSMILTAEQRARAEASRVDALARLREREPPMPTSRPVTPFDCSGDAGGGGGLGGGGFFTGHASTHAPMPAAPAAFRPQPVAPRGGGGGGGGFGGGGGQRRSAPVLPTTSNRLGLMAEPARSSAEATARFMQGTLKRHANEKRAEHGLRPLKMNSAQRHDWKGDAELPAILATARQEHLDILAGGAPARRERQRQELRAEATKKDLDASQVSRLQALESMEPSDTAALEDFQERKWGSAPQAKKGARHAQPTPTHARVLRLHGALRARHGHVQHVSTSPDDF